ncbi:MAG TPA: Rieske (2Fe-2S) protein [Chloroflexota bacterium]|nr:Rieske (2Fe-2S) protein [Chloroflexota bacterium]
MSEQDDMRAVDAANAYVEALLRGEKPAAPRPLQGDDAAVLRQAAQLAAVDRREVVPSAEFVSRLHERVVGEPRRPAWLGWRINRRVFAGGLAGGVAAVVVAMFGEQVTARLPGHTSLPAGWVPVAKAAELPPGTVKRFIAQDVEGHIMNIGGNIWALSAICTHMACVVDWQAADDAFLCPCHGAEFDTAGRQMGVDDYGVRLSPLARIPVQQRDGELYVVLAPSA